MSRNKKYIVITGQIASGKSSISKFLENRSEDFLVLDADDQINDLYRRGAVLYDVLVNEFGDSILNEKRNISKARLREVVFFNDENRKRLNDLTHPVILRNMVNIAKNSDKETVFLQIPLLNESIKKLEKLIDISEVWNITARDDIRFDRLMQRKGMTESVAKRIMEIQSDFDSDKYDILTVENNGDIDELEDKIDLFFENGILAKKFKKGLLNRKIPKTVQNEFVEKKNDSNISAVMGQKFEDEEYLRELFKESDDKNIETVSDLVKEDVDKSIYGETTNLDKTKVVKLMDAEEFENRNSDEEKIFFFDEVSDEKNFDSKKVKEKKKMKMWKKILIGLLGILILLKALFFGAVAYGGKNYPVKYVEQINKYASEYNVDPKLVIAIMKVESNFNPTAQSHANAKGLMQLLPETAKHVATLLKVDQSSIDLNDEETNIKFGTYYLRYLMNNFTNMDTVYAAYNGGMGNVQKWLKDEKYSNDGVSLYNIPASETKNYVTKVNKALKAYEILYGDKLPTNTKTGFSRFIENSKNVIKYLIKSF